MSLIEHGVPQLPEHELAPANPLVLLVMDVDDAAPLLRAVLHEHGYCLVAISSGTDAVETCRRLHPDVLLLDVTWPNGSALDVCRETRPHPGACSVPALVLSARVDPAAVQAAASAGADAFMSKPFSTSALLGTLRRLVRTAAVPPD